MFLLSTTSPPLLSFFFFFNDTATTEIYTLSLHDALPICLWSIVTSGEHTCTAAALTMQTKARPGWRNTGIPNLIEPPAWPRRKSGPAAPVPSSTASGRGQALGRLLPIPSDRKAALSPSPPLREPSLLSPRRASSA